VVLGDQKFGEQQLGLGVASISRGISSWA